MRKLLILFLFISLSAAGQSTFKKQIVAENGVSVTGNNGVTLSGVGTMWDDLQFPAYQLKSVGITDKPDYDVVKQELLFPEDTTEAVGFVVQMPHDWKEGSSIYPHIHYMQTAADSIDWTFKYKWVNIGGTEPGAWTVKKLSHNTQTYTSGTIHQVARVVNGFGVVATGKTISSILVVKFYRQSDAHVGDARFLQLDIHYERDAFGSKTEYIK
jgi:hypothetical protein